MDSIVCHFFTINAFICCSQKILVKTSLVYSNNPAVVEGYNSNGMCGGCSCIDNGCASEGCIAVVCLKVV